MFQKKDMIYSNVLGVCKVEDVVNLPAGQNQLLKYYVLHSLMDQNKKSYIPVDHHEMELRELITEEEALNLEKMDMEQLSDLQRFEIQYVKENRTGQIPGRKA